MRTLIQRVRRAAAFASQNEEQMITKIEKGLLLFVAFENEDSPVSIEQTVVKIKNLRIFSDESGKMNLSAPQVEAEYLIVSQFTLYADCRYGNRPSFDKAATKTRAKEYFEHFVVKSRLYLGDTKVKNTPFGSDLRVELVNDGPVTIWLDGTSLS